MGQNDIKVAITGDSTQLAQSVKRAEGTIREFSASAQNYVAILQGAVTSLVAAFGGLQLGAFFKDSVMLAANIEQANVALGSIATSLGVSSAEAIKYRDSLRDINITTSAATNATAQFLRAGLPLDGLNQLGQAAQGAAISYNMLGKETISSSEALEKMVRAIVTGNVKELKTLGFQTMLLDLLRENKLATGEAATEVDSHARRMLVFNDVIKQSGSLMNLYSDSTGLATKNISSSKRPLEELRVAFGNLFLPELTQASAAFYATLIDGQQWVKANKEEMDGWKDTISSISDFLVTMSKLEFTSIKEFAGLEFNGWKGLFELAGIEGVADILNGLDVTIQAIGNSIAALAAAAPHVAQLILHNFNPEISQREADAIKAIYEQSAADLDQLLTRKNPYKKTPEDKAREEEQASILAEEKGFYQELARIKGEANNPKNEDDGAGAAKAAKASSDAWKKVYGDLKFEAAGYYDAQIKLINQQTEEYRKAGVSAVILEQWKKGQIKKLDEEMTKSSDALYKEEQDRMLKEVEWEQKLRNDAAKEEKDAAKDTYEQQQKYLDEWFKKDEAKASEMSEIWKQAYRNMENAASDFFLDAMHGNFSNFLDSFQSMIDQMVANWMAGQAMMTMFGPNFGKSDGTDKIGGLIGMGLNWLAGGGSANGSYGVLATATGTASMGIPAGGYVPGGGYMPSFAVGTDYVPRDMIAQIHKGERIIPAAQNTPGTMAKNTTVINNFTLTQPADRRTQQQIAAMAGGSIRTAMKRNG